MPATLIVKNAILVIFFISLSVHLFIVSANIAKAQFDPYNVDVDFAVEVKDEGEVELRFVSSSPCSAYKVSWGDGQEEIQTSPENAACSSVLVTEKLTHTYNQSGRYQIMLTRGDSTNIHVVEIGLKQKELTVGRDIYTQYYALGDDLQTEVIGANKVRLSLELSSAGADYVVLWGDGTHIINGYEKYNPSEGLSPAVFVTEVLEHEYSEDGDYTIVVLTNNNVAHREISFNRKNVSRSPIAEFEYEEDASASSGNVPSGQNFDQQGEGAPSGSSLTKAFPDSVRGLGASTSLIGYSLNKIQSTIIFPIIEFVLTRQP